MQQKKKKKKKRKKQTKILVQGMFFSRWKYLFRINFVGPCTKHYSYPPLNMSAPRGQCLPIKHDFEKRALYFIGQAQTRTRHFLLYMMKCKNYKVGKVTLSYSNVYNFSNLCTIVTNLVPNITFQRIGPIIPKKIMFAASFVERTLFAMFWTFLVLKINPVRLYI